MGLAEFLPSAYRYLMNDDPFTALIGTDVGMDSNATDAYNKGWVFQGLDGDGRPYRDPQGSGKAAVVLTSRDGWASPNMHNTATFPSLQVLIYADVSRSLQGSPTARDAEARCKRVYEKVDRVFHDPSNSTHGWDGVRIVSCVRSSELSISDIPGSDLMVRGLVRYNVVLA